MMTGVVNAHLEALVRLTVRGPGGQEQEIEAVIDTGFSGSLTLPPSLIASLDLAWRSRSSAVLANANIEQFDVYAATVIWDGQPRSIMVQAIDNVPLGMALLIGYDLRVRVNVGGVVEIQEGP